MSWRAASRRGAEHYSDQYPASGRGCGGHSRPCSFAGARWAGRRGAPSSSGSCRKSARLSTSAWSAAASDSLRDWSVRPRRQHRAFYACERREPRAKSRTRSLCIEGETGWKSCGVSYGGTLGMRVRGTDAGYGDSYVRARNDLEAPKCTEMRWSITDSEARRQRTIGTKRRGRGLEVQVDSSEPTVTDLV